MSRLATHSTGLQLKLIARRLIRALDGMKVVFQSNKKEIEFMKELKEQLPVALELPVAKFRVANEERQRSPISIYPPVLMLLRLPASRKDQRRFF